MSFDQYHFSHPEAIEHLSQIPGYDPSFHVVYFNNWIEFESYGWLAIFEKDGNLFLGEGGSGPGDEAEDRIDYISTSMEEAILEIEDMEALCNEASSHNFG